MADETRGGRTVPAPSGMPQVKPLRIVQGRYTQLCRKWTEAANQS